ncbi:MAG: IS21 family transposase [Nitrospinota bacterium]|nr:IS21 family transposase [Nitrospinota bacterium]
MSNKLKMAKIYSIIGLLDQGWSYRRIERELGVRRETVSRYDRLRQADSKPAISPTGSEDSDGAKPAIPPPGSLAGRKSLCGPLADVIRAKLDAGLSAKRVWQDLVTEHGFVGGYDSVKRYVRRTNNKAPLPFRRMECDPGSEAQIDFGSGAWVIENGKRRRPHLFRITLSHSRKSYSEAVWRQTTENFIRAIENAFRSFGGVPRTLVIDNLKAAVKNADWFDPEFNPKIIEFARHYGAVFLPTKPRTPRHKGKIESGVKYAKNNALKGRTFSSLAEQNSFLAEWESSVADTRIHGTTKKQVKAMFDVERKFLLPLPTEPFPFYHEGKRRVHRDGHIEVAKSYYSVPPEYLGRDVWARWDGRLVRVFNDRFEQVAVHSRVEPGRFNTSQAHLADEKISGVERGAEYLLAKAGRMGEESGQWARAMLDQRGIEGVRVLQGFVGLAKKHPSYAINHASRVALDSNMFRLRPLRELIKRTTRQAEIEFAEEHEIIRPLAEYQRLLTVSFKPTDERSDHEPTTQGRPEAPEALRAALHPGGEAAGGGRGATQPHGVSGADRKR